MGIWGPYEIPWPILGGAVEVRNHSEPKKHKLGCNRRNYGCIST